MSSPISVSTNNVGSNTATSNTVLRGIVAVNLPSLSEAVQLSTFTKNTMSTLPGHLLVVFIVLLLAGLIYCAVRQRRSSVTSGLPLTVDQTSDTSNDVQTADKNERVIVTFEPSRTVYTMPEDLPPYKMPLGKTTTGTTLCSHCQVSLGAGGKTTCKGCKTALFCDNECQRQGWANHKRECKQMRHTESARIVQPAKHQSVTVKEIYNHVSELLTDDQNRTATINVKSLCCLAQSDFVRRAGESQAAISSLTPICKLNVTLIRDNDICHYNLVHQREGLGAGRRTALVKSMMEKHPDRVVIHVTNGNIGVWYQHLLCGKTAVAVTCGRPVSLQDTLLKETTKHYAPLASSVAHYGFNPLKSPCEYRSCSGYTDDHSLTTCPEMISILNPQTRRTSCVHRRCRT